MHETFQKIGHLPVNVHFTMNRYPIRNHHAVISKVTPRSNQSMDRKFHQISESILFPTENNFDPTDNRKFRWKVNRLKLVKTGLIIGFEINTIT